MATSFSPAPVSNISELNGLGATSSITLPKKKIWKRLAIVGAILTLVGSASFMITKLGIMKEVCIPSVTLFATETPAPVASFNSPATPAVEGYEVPKVPLVLAAEAREVKPAIVPTVPKSKKMQAQASVNKTKAAWSKTKMKPQNKKAIAKSKLKRVEKPIANTTVSKAKPAIKAKSKADPKATAQLKVAR